MNVTNTKAQFRLRGALQLSVPLLKVCWSLMVTERLRGQGTVEAEALPLLLENRQPLMMCERGMAKRQLGRTMEVASSKLNSEELVS